MTEKTFKIVIVVLLLMPFVPIIGYPVYRWVKEDIYHISSGSNGGTYFVVGQKLAETLTSAFQKEALQKKLRFENQQSKGAQQNLERIHRGEVELAFAQEGLEARANVRAIAKLYRSLLHVVLNRKDERFKNVTTMRGLKNTLNKGARVKTFIGADQSGTRVVSKLVLDYYGIVVTRADAMDHGQLEIVEENWSFDKASEKLKEGEIQLAFFVVGPGSDALKKLEQDGKLLDLGLHETDGLSLANPFFEPAQIYKHTYTSAFPPENVHTVSVGEVLICNSEINDRLAYRIAQAISMHTHELGPKRFILKDFSKAQLEQSVYYPFHPGAAAFYKGQNIPFSPLWDALWNLWVRNRDVLTLAAGWAISALAIFRGLLRRRRVQDLLGDFRAREDDIRQAGPEAIAEETHALERTALALLANGKISQDGYGLIKDYIRVYRDSPRK